MREKLEFHPIEPNILGVAAGMAMRSVSRFTVYKPSTSLVL